MGEEPGAAPNVQDRNVGNRGDVHKHAALVALVELLAARSAGPVRHVETHCFRLDAPLPDPARVAGFDAELPPAAAAWRRLEAPWLARGRYRCSAGLALDVLGPRARLALAEAHGPTRAALAAALSAEEAPLDTLVDDAGALPAAPLADPRPLPLSIHVDPFDHPVHHWPTVERLLAAWRRPDQDAVVLAFAYDRAGPIRWPGPPRGLVALGEWAMAPYGLAAWGTPTLAEEARGRLGALGWAVTG